MKKIIWVISSILMILILASCGNSNNNKNVDNNDDAHTNASEVTLKLGHVGPAEEDHPWEKYAKLFAEKVADETDSEVQVETYAASALGADREMTESIQQGTLEMGLISTIAMGNFVPELQVWDLPYIFPIDNDKVDEIIEGPVGDKLAEAAEKKDIVIIGYWENDWRQMSNSKKEIRTVDDLKGLKMRVVENQPSLDWFERIKTIPTPMAFSELYTALQQKTVDGQDNGAILTYGSKLYEAQSHFTMTNHMYAPLAVVVSKKVWDKLSEDQQEIMKETAVSLGQEQRDYNREMVKEYIDEMKEAGVEVVDELTDEELKTFQDSAEDTYDALSSEIGEDLINDMLEYRE